MSKVLEEIVFMMKVALAVLFLTQPLITLATDVYSDQFQRVRSVELYEITDDTNEEKLIEKKELPSELSILLKRSRVKSVTGAVGVIMITKELIALGEEIYEIIDAGKPVADINSTPVSVLPKNNKGEAIAAYDLTNWKVPKAKKYKVVTTNYLGMRPASFEFMLIYTYGGDYQGKGKYISSAQIKPTAVNLKWGYDLNVNFSVQSITNQGSTEDPIAGAVLELSYKISNVLQEVQNSKTFYINGLGLTKEY